VQRVAEIQNGVNEFLRDFVSDKIRRGAKAEPQGQEGSGLRVHGSTFKGQGRQGGARTETTVQKKSKKLRVAGKAFP
jgi:hypothetical protein